MPDSPKQPLPKKTDTPTGHMRQFLAPALAPAVDFYQGLVSAIQKDRSAGRNIHPAETKRDKKTALKNAEKLKETNEQQAVYQEANIAFATHTAQCKNQAKELLLAAQKISHAVGQGAHPRRRAGIGESFWQYRPFDAQDGSHRIDWRRSARGDSLYIRESEWEAAQTLWIWRDPSPSLSYTSRKRYPTKGWRGEVIALALARLAFKSGEKVGFLHHLRPKNHSTRSSSAAHKTARPSSKTSSPVDSAPLYPAKITHEKQLGHAALHLIQGRDLLTYQIQKKKNKHQMTADQKTAPASSAPPPEIDQKDFLAQMNQRPKHSHLLLISDFLDGPEIWEPRFKLMAQRQLHVTCLCLSDPAEEKLPFKGRVRFSGLQQERPLLVRKVQEIRGDYQQRRQAHFKWFQHYVAQMGGHWLSHVTHQPLGPVFLQLRHMLEENKAPKKPTFSTKTPAPPSVNKEGR